MSENSKQRRRELIREYKRTPKDMGVYRILNTANGKSYVASSRDITARLNRHRLCLKNNMEQVRALQDDWNRFGAEAFSFEVVDLLEPADKPGYNPDEDLAVLNDLWLEKLKPYGDNGYNKEP